MIKEYTGKQVLKRFVAFTLCATVAVTTAFFGVPLSVNATEGDNTAEENTVYTIGVADDRNWMASVDGEGESSAISKKGVLLWTGEKVISSSRFFSEWNSAANCHHDGSVPDPYSYDNYVGFSISSVSEEVVLDTLGDLVSGEAEMVTGGTMNSSTGQTDNKTTEKMTYHESFTAKKPVFVEYDTTTDTKYAIKCDCAAKTDWDVYHYYLYCFKVNEISTSPVNITFNVSGDDAILNSDKYPASHSFAVSNSDATYNYEVPAKFGYVFDGWEFKDSNGNAVSVSGAISDSKDGALTFEGVNASNWETVDALSKVGNITATPTWKQKNLTINYDPDGGVCYLTLSVCIETENNISYDLYKDDTESVYVPEATREGYTFDGWYVNDTKITCLADIPKESWNSDQIYNFKAKWTAGDNPPDYTIDTTTGTLIIKSQDGFPSEENGKYAKRVVVSEGITEIPASAFAIFQMEGIEFPSTIKTIGNMAFYGSDIKSITIPDGVTEIPYGCFNGCSNLEKVVLPDSVVSIEENAFLQLGDSDTSAKIHLSSNLESIGKAAFYGAYISEINIPASVTTISDKAFYNATIDEVTFAGTQEQWAALCEQAQELKAATVTYVDPPAHVHTGTKVAAVAATCEKAGNSEYYTCSCGKYFSDATCTKEIVKDSWVIAATGHDWDEGEITKPATTTEAGIRTHHCKAQGCTATKTSEIEKLKEQPHVHAGTKVVAVAATCEKAGNSEYYICSCGKYFSDAACTKEMVKDSWVIAATGHKWDEGTVTKEATATEAGEKTYKCSVCGMTKTETIPATGVPKTGTEIKDEKGTASYEVTGSDTKNPTVTYTENKNSKATTVSIPATVTVEGVTYKVTEIADNAFKDNKKITQVTISKNVTTVGQNAFYGCTKLKTVTVGSNVTTIGANAFKNCKALTKITLASKTTKIGANAFKGCSKLKTITIKSKKMTSKTISKNAFEGVSSKTTIKVPKGKVKAYKTLLRKKGLSQKVKVK